MARRMGWTAGVAVLLAVSACGGGSDKNTDATTTTKAASSTTAGSSTTSSGSAAASTTAPDQTGTTSSEVATTADTGPTTIGTVPPDVTIDTEVSLETVTEGTDVPDTEPPTQAELPADGPATVGGVDLPAGKVLVAGDQRLAWITDAAVPGAAGIWKQLYDAYPQTGLYPVLLYDDDQPAHWEEDIFFPNQPNEIKNLKYDEVLQNAADLYTDAPRPNNGAAPASSGSADETTTDATVAALPDTRILLVEAPDGPSSLSYMGWTGNATYDTAEAMVVAVQSWADRYGAYVVAVGPNSVRLGITTPPATSGEAAALSQELVLMDPDLTGGLAPLPVVGLDDALIGQHLWTLWWQ